MSSMPPPPALAPPNPWAGRTRPQDQAPLRSGGWPWRLLYVPSTTSHVRVDSDTCNGYKAPQYNVLSYTWGNFIDPPGTALSVHGVDWPIPAIQDQHFTADSFNAAIERAATGVRHRCQWFWVDVACIPQRHENETREAKETRDEEIGRQAEIFRRAKEAFAWLFHRILLLLFRQSRAPQETLAPLCHVTSQLLRLRPRVPGLSSNWAKGSLGA